MIISKQTIIQVAVAACMMLIILPAIVHAQPDTLWVRGISNGSRPMEVIRTFDGGFAIGGAGWCGDEDRRDLDFSIIKTDSVGSIEWREFYTIIPDTLQTTERAYAIEQLSDGGYVLSGRGAGGAMIARTDSTGDMLWSRSYDLNAWFYDSAVTDDGNIVVASTSGWARKIDMEDGDIIWQHSYHVENDGRFWNITETMDNGFLLTGEISSIGEGSADMYAVKIDRDGELEWYNTYGTEYFEVIGHAIQTADRGYCMVGGSHDGHLNNYGMIVRTDSDGEEIWRNIFADEDDNIILSFLGIVTETPDGGFAVVSAAGARDTYLSRVNSDGELIWRTTYPINRGSLDTFSLLLMDDFGYLIGGWATGIGDWLLLTEPDSLSVISWDLQADRDSVSFEEVPIDSTAGLELTLINEAEYPVYIQNITTDSMVFSVDFDGILLIEPDEEASIPVTFTPTDSIDYSGVLTAHTKFRDLMVKLSGTGVYLSVSEMPGIVEEFTLNEAYPNPFNSTTNINFDLPKNSFVSVIITDINGRRIETLLKNDLIAGRHSLIWNAKNYPAGIYLCRMETDGYRKVRKMVLVK